MKTIVTNIVNCFECPKYDHSGAFTKGGAIPLCRGVSDEKYKYHAKELPYKTSTNSRTGQPMRKATGKIPTWCPL